jgi:hypothetical protein
MQKENIIQKINKKRYKKQKQRTEVQTKNKKKKTSRKTAKEDTNNSSAVSMAKKFMSVSGRSEINRKEVRHS